ncbi:MAG: WG repeat-containing protein, partial [Alphaproteobacteria bacterium]|nr:WG repeat-containing protein [Alphaproteobacteria bacterium]
MLGKWVPHALPPALAALVIFAATGDAASFVLMSCSPGQFADRPADTNGLTIACGGKFNLCGYADKAGNEVIAQQFEVALPFSGGLAGVRTDGKFGFVDLTGKLVIPAKFDLVGYFSNGLAEVVLNGKAGVIDRQGAVIIEPNYARAMPFGDHTILVREGAWPPMRPDFCESLRDSKSTLQFDFVKYPTPRYRIWNVTTRSFSSEAYDLRYFDDPDRKLLWARTVDSGAPGKFGLLRLDGSWRTVPSYDDVSPLMDGYATVCDLNPAPSSPLKRKTCGAVDPKGELVVPMTFDGTSYWRNGLKLVRRGKEKGIVDTSGTLLGGRYFADAQVAEKGGVSLVRIGNEWMGLDRQGRIVANPEDGQVLSQCPSGLRVEKRSGKLRFVDANGKATEPYLFDSPFLKLDCDGPTPVQLNGK